MLRIPVAIIRGGTSKGVFMERSDLPCEGADLQRLLLAIFGSPDPRQIDGLGGADPLTSKAAIVAPSERPGVDVDYTFAQVGIDTAFVDFSLSCGNLLSGVGIFAILRGLKEAEEPLTTVTVYDTNTKKLARLRIPVKDGKPVSEGNFFIDGVPFGGARIDETFIEPAGSITGRLFPTGNKKESFGGVEASLVDAGVMALFVRASDLGLTGSEGPSYIDGDAELIRRIEVLRAEALVRAGMSGNRDLAVREFPNLPKVILVAPPMDFVAPVTGRHVCAKDITLLGRVVTGGKLHKAFPVTSAIAVAAAVSEPETVVREVVGEFGNHIVIGHPSGVIDVSFSVSEGGAIREVTVGRTARLIMDGFVYIPEGRLR